MRNLIGWRHWHPQVCSSTYIYFPSFHAFFEIYFIHAKNRSIFHLGLEDQVVDDLIGHSVAKKRQKCLWQQNIAGPMDRFTKLCPFISSCCCGAHYMLTYGDGTNPCTIYNPICFLNLSFEKGFKSGYISPSWLA